MIRYKIIVAYDGTDFSGWQVQPGRSSIEKTLKDTFLHVFKKHISVTGASRTDAGVHALGQVARFETDLLLDQRTMRHAWNNMLPKSIVIRSLFNAPDLFHPFYNVVDKTYYYHFFLNRPFPFVQRYGWYYWYPIDLKKLNDTLQLFVGTHNFRAFSTVDPIGDNPMCTIYDINVEFFQRFGFYRITVRGKRFLRHMVRALVGAALHAAALKNNVSITDVAQILDSKNPNHNLPTAPACGLVLCKIRYKL